MSRYYNTADYRASYVRQLRYMVDSNRNSLRHPDFTSSRIIKDEEDVWFDLFTSEALDLCNFSTGASPEKDVVTDILAA